MKRVAGRYSVRSVSINPSIPTTATRFLWWVPQIPDYFWLMMIILTVSALSISTLMRSQEQEQEARASYSYVKARIENAKSINQRIKEHTEQIKTNPQIAAQTAQDQLLLLRRNEVVVAVP